MRIVYKSLDELEVVAKKIIKFANEKKDGLANVLRVWTFEGEMGSGKTTLIKALAKEMKVMDTVQSPTFSIVNEYHTKEGDVIYHFDFYRINKESEAYDLGYEEYFYDKNFCWIEWPSKIQSLIPEKHLNIKITVVEDSRLVELIKYE